MDWLIDYLTGTVAAPVWALWALPIGAGLAAGLWCWATLVGERTRRRAAEQAASYYADRVAVQQPATEALTRVLAAPGEVAGSDLPPRDATVDVTAIAVDYPPLDLSGAFDVFDTDDEPEEPGDDRDPPAGGGAVPAEAYQAAILPRYRWSGADPWPADRGVMPGRWSMLRWRLDRWAIGARESWGRLRAYLAERWEAADWDRSPGWAPGEATQVMTGEQPAVYAPEPLPRSRPPQHLEGYRKLWAAVLVGEFRATGADGRHRAGVAAGALAQRQGRLLALPAGAP